jgi:hypothetical protein
MEYRVETDVTPERRDAMRETVLKALRLHPDVIRQSLGKNGELPFPQVYDRERKMYIPSRSGEYSPSLLRLSSSSKKVNTEFTNTLVGCASWYKSAGDDTSISTIESK